MMCFDESNPISEGKEEMGESERARFTPRSMGELESIVEFEGNDVSGSSSFLADDCARRTCSHGSFVAVVLGFSWTASASGMRFERCVDIHLILYFCFRGVDTVPVL